MLARMWGKGNTTHWWWECKLVQPLWKSVCVGGAQKVRQELTHSICTVPGHRSEGLCTLQRCLLACILCCLFTIAQKHNQPRSPPSDEWLMKMLYINMMKLYSSIKNEIYRRMVRTGKYTEWVIQAQKGKHCMHVLSHTQILALSFKIGVSKLDCL